MRKKQQFNGASILLFIVFFSSCHLRIKDKDVEKSQTFQKVTDAIKKLKAQKLRKNDLAKGVISKQMDVLEYDNLKFPFKLYEITNESGSILVKVNTIIEKEKLMIPTIIVTNMTGEKLPVKSDDFYLNKEHQLEAKWSVELTAKGQYFLFLLSDVAEKESTMHSGVISYFSPAYYNFSKEIKNKTIGTYEVSFSPK